MTSRKTTKAQSFRSWLNQARQDFERFASDEERDALQWIQRHMPAEPLLWDALANHHR